MLESEVETVVAPVFKAWALNNTSKFFCTAPENELIKPNPDVDVLALISRVYSLSLEYTTPMKTFWLGLALGVGGLAVAQSIQKTLELRVNGASVGKAYVIAGQTYVPVNALKAFNLVATQTGNTLSLGAAGGSNQVAALEGCLGQTLFNGVHRVTVKSVDAITVTGTPTWGVTIEVRNGTKRALTLFDAGVRSGSVFIAATDGNPRDNSNNGTASRELDKELIYKSLPPGGFVTYQVKFVSLSSSEEPKPSKFLMTIDKSKALKDLPFSAPDPSFRVNLECQK